VDDARTDVDSVHGEPQSPPPGALPPDLLPSLVGDEIGADDRVVLAPQGRRDRRGGGAAILAARADGARAHRGADGTATPPGSRKQQSQQRFEEAGDTVTHVVNSVGFVDGHAPGPVARSRGYRFE
jgi:hypothetical protein